ncbi:MAG: nucleotidyltransferase family protein [Gemmatimonadales bacterium]|nr:MAG: nucleotidyltransferase family protein [Gemmatimonadales bacterium]
MKAVVLAAGRGSRMRDTAESVRLSDAQRREADRGRKTLIPFHGHPFLSYLLSELAAGGVTQVCVVVGPDPGDPVRRAAEALNPTRISIDFAVQASPEGSAHALAAARPFATRSLGPESDGFLVVNADNLYPASAVAALVGRTGHAMVGFRQRGLLGGTITPERLSAFALIRTGPDGCLKTIVEKPGPTDRKRSGLDDDVLVSMTLWRFTPEVFDLCEGLERSPRREFELPDAVTELVGRRGRCLQVVPVDAPVLDLTHRRDIPVVDALLEGREPTL